MRAAAVQRRYVLICKKDFKASLCFLAHLFLTSLREKQVELVSRAEIIILDVFVPRRMVRQSDSPLEEAYVPVS